MVLRELGFPEPGTDPVTLRPAFEVRRTHVHGVQERTSHRRTSHVAEPGVGHMAGHRQSKKRRYVTWAVAGAAVVAGAGIAAQSSMAATTWPAQKTYTGRAFDTCTAPSARRDEGLARRPLRRRRRLHRRQEPRLRPAQPHRLLGEVGQRASAGSSSRCTSAPSRPARPAPTPRSSPPPPPPPSARPTRRTRSPRPRRSA